MLKREFDKLNEDSKIAISPEAFLDTCKRTELDQQSSGILSYMDSSEPYTVDHLGILCIPNDFEFTLNAHTKFISIQRRNVEVTVNSKGIPAMKEAFISDTNFLQKSLFDIYEELGEKHRQITNWSPFTVKNEIDALKVVNLSSLYIAKNGRHGGGNFIVIGRKFYEALLSSRAFIQCANSLEMKINHVGEVYNHKVFLNLEDDNTFVMGRTIDSAMAWPGVYLFENKKELVEMPASPTSFKSYSSVSFKAYPNVYLISHESLGYYGNHPEYNYFTPTLLL